MRRLAFAAVLVISLPHVAAADPLDLHIFQLGNPATDPNANARFSALMNEFGAAISNWNLEPPETTGFAGFNFAFELPISLINGGGQVQGVNYWPFESTTANSLLMPGIHVRKGFPFSFEAGAKVNYITDSSMVVSTVEAKWALNEGFIYFPDLGVRGFGTQLIGARDFNLTVAGLDIGLGKQIPINGMFTLTPYLGWSSFWVAASSNVIEFRPDLSEQQQMQDGQDGTSNQNVFDSLSIGANRHDRFYLGVRFISYIVELGMEGSYALVNANDPESGQQVNSFNVWTFSSKLGLDF